ncbi:TetR/AcrR family transcriptional regulator [Conexibacter sp. JD483]|uniref:TetR/AcrR family transcriptional regulator n=1 Tax=unclassified Conexibacter TaxID=2627773 RepID=UPI002721F909|nr:MULTISPECIES: TetR/AcrR family transcriptional regulator [unclassified Conexibacter]MDO8188598.1 TetR/AcrR family transcriptional regulator [Conexibacter sp. CPCC 205706]MDO8201488.1 TetR/AcrR family transcriptional regulator [Conexibacter sp. CPCC 205762]MDR9370855.1 TetR/AcrR family transcriptional regulator [Conexibacter sp. JD483]
MQIADLPPAKASAARDRLLGTASAIFYAEGINSVGVDRIVSEGAVTRATFYRHFASKQDLVLAYLQAAHDAIEAGFAALAAAHDAPERLLEAVAADIARQIEQPGFHGCAFICAAAEFEDPDDPIRRAVVAHRDWFLGAIRDAFTAAGHSQPEEAALQYVILRDGAMVGGHLGDSARVAQTFQQSVSELLRSAGGSAR